MKTKRNERKSHENTDHAMFLAMLIVFGVFAWLWVL